MCWGKWLTIVWGLGREWHFILCHVSKYNGFKTYIKNIFLFYFVFLCLVLTHISWFNFFLSIPKNISFIIKYLHLSYSMWNRKETSYLAFKYSHITFNCQNIFCWFSNPRPSCMTELSCGHQQACFLYTAPSLTKP